MNIFGGKKSEFEAKVDQLKSVFNQEFGYTDTALECLQDWARLEFDYARELMIIKHKLDKIPQVFQ